MAMKIDLEKTADRDYAIMLIAEVGCVVKGIDDPSLYESAGVQLRASEEASMMSRMIRASYTRTRNAGVWIPDETIHAYDQLLELYETRYFEALAMEARKMKEANKKIADCIAALWDRTHATIH